MTLDYFRVAACVPCVKPGDCQSNVDSIINIASALDKEGVRLAVFPELSITGYTCADLFQNRFMLDNAVAQLARLAEKTANLKMAMIVGAPIIYNNVLFNCGVVVGGGKVRMIVPKTYTPNYGEFYERRWFTPAYDAIEGNITLVPKVIENVPFGRHQLMAVDGVRIGIEICEDLWVPIPPSSFLALGGAEIVANLSASDDTIGKYNYLTTMIKQQSGKIVSAYVYSSVGFGESSTDAVFDGKAIVAECGRILAKNSRWNSGEQWAIADIDLEVITHDRMMKNTFADCARHSNPAAYRVNEFFTGRPSSQTSEIRHGYSTSPFIPEDSEWEERCDEVVNIQSAGLAQRMVSTGCRKIVVGISGGLDSTLALLVACKTFDRLGLSRDGIIGVTMPGFGTTGRTHDNAVELMKALGVETREISIVPGVEQHFKDIGHDPKVHDVTYENAQARMRTYLLMDIANQDGGMVLGTGDMSELALGWATFNGDHMSMYGVNAGVPKTLVRSLVEWFAEHSDNATVNRCLKDILDTPISPELLPAAADNSIKQKTEDLVGPYELHDFFLYHVLRYGRPPRKIFHLAKKAFGDAYSDSTILHWLRTFFRRFFNQQFKRSCMPDGPKVSDTSLSPRSDWRMPSDASSAQWLRDIDQLEKEVGA